MHRKTGVDKRNSMEKAFLCSFGYQAILSDLLKGHVLYDISLIDILLLNLETPDIDCVRSL